jgi:ureidoacrylate peracid hydrolase
MLIKLPISVLKDATADYSNEEMHSALEINIPNYGSAIVTTDEVADSISFLNVLRIKFL